MLETEMTPEQRKVYARALKKIEACRRKQGTWLDLSGLSLTRLPPEIGHLTKLTGLLLYNNRLNILPPELGKLPKLAGLFLHGNAALAIPNFILGPTFIDTVTAKRTAARPQDILNFYFARRQGVAAGTLRAVNEIKVVLVGRGGAGKTSMRRFFIGEPHDKDEWETPGIALDSFRLHCTKGEITVRLWDFAGQVTTHALHRFFLTEGCVYVLVLDPRSNTEMEDAEYWLGLLKRYADGAPVLVALNRQDARLGGYDVNRRLLQEHFPSIVSFTRTDCASRAGCAELRRRLGESVESLRDTEPPHLKVPEAWLKVMEDCTTQAKPQSTGTKLSRSLALARHAVPSAEGRQHLTLEEFRAICSKHGEKDPAKQGSLARLLHKLGAVLHFVDEPRLRDTAVLNPHWVTDGVYRLLRFKDRPGSDGTLTLAEALAALPGEKEKEARFLLRLMERFELCFPVVEEASDKLPTQWFIPGTLEEFEPETVTADWQKPGGVRLRYIYKPLSDGVLPRFIVMTHLLSDGKPRWRHGVVLAEGTATALVRRGEDRNVVEVTAFGPEDERLRLLEIIQGNLDRVHVDLPDPKPVAEIELAGLTGIFRPVADLEVAELYKQKVAVAARQCTTLMNPTLLLNQTSEPAARTEGRVPLNAFLSYSHEDKGAKAIFQQNLTVMTKKKLITPWHDGLIEPGMRWREEIEENLGKMDIFVGLLTTAFLASDFIEKVELKAARAKLSKEARDFQFVLILVDNISLAELDLAEYQILKPGGKAVSQHASRKDGFNVAQKQLEQLLLHRQAEKKRRQEDDELSCQQLATPMQTLQGMTIMVGGSYIAGAEPMARHQGIHISGNITNTQAGQSLTNCTNLVQQQAPGARKDLLKALAQQVQQFLNDLPPEKHEEVAGNLEWAVKAATSATPNRKWYSLSTEELLEAAKVVQDPGGNIAGTIKKLGTSLWPDFVLPKSDSVPRRDHPSPAGKKPAAHPG